jgi:5,6-dimethylbenzimidazole synthase
VKIQLTAPQFSDEFRARFHELLIWRRDVRRFRTDPLPHGLLAELLDQARLAPSVGLSEPWRFVQVNTPAVRREINAEFERANAEALEGYDGEQAQRYARLKLAGLDCAPVHLAVFVDRETAKGSGLGRHSMPETLGYSAVGAIHTLWLAARVRGVGLGWISILDPRRIAEILDVPEGWGFVAYLCLGFPEEDSTTPELERAGWEQRAVRCSILER